MLPPLRCLVDGDAAHLDLYAEARHGWHQHGKIAGRDQHLDVIVALQACFYSRACFCWQVRFYLLVHFYQKMQRYQKAQFYHQVRLDLKVHRALRVLLALLAQVAAIAYGQAGPAPTRMTLCWHVVQVVVEAYYDHAC